MNKQLLLVLVVLFCTSLKISAQCPTATVPDTVCAGEPFDITNTTPGFDSYYWDFCTGDLNNAPAGINQGNIGGLFNSAHQIDIVEENGNFYGFVANFNGNNIIRLDYGNSPGNLPAGVALTVNGLSGPTGIQMIKEGANWYALVQNYFSSQLILFDFGNSITNNSPVDINLGQLNLSTPFHLKAIKQNNNLFVFSANFSSNNVVKLEFGNSITNAPTSTVISDPSFVSPFGIDISYDCANDKYIGVISNMNGASVSILDFGNSLQNLPAITFFNSFSLNLPTSINILKDALKWHVIITNESGNYTQVDFGNSLLNTNPSVLFNGPLGSLSTPRGMKFFNFESTWYGNIINWGGSLTQVTYPDSCLLSSKFSYSANPAGINFITPGSFVIELVADFENVSYSYVDSIIVLDVPNAYFGISNSNCDNNFQFSDSSTTPVGTITDWLWDFGDGNTSVQQNPSHSYTAPGSYVVQLTVTNSFGCSSTYSTSINNNKPVASFTVNDGCVVPPMEFLNTSPDPQNIINNWLWDFGDGNSSLLKSPQHIYSNPGTYIVTLTASIGSCSHTFTDTITYQPKPDVQFNVLNTCFNQQQQFNNLTTIAFGNISSYNWSFGDGNFSNLANPIHQYGDTGNYQVSLIAVANNGCSDTLSNIVRVSLQPNAGFNYPASTLCSENSITFQDNTNVIGDTINNWLWDFGDGNFSASMNPTHIYNNAGIYTVTLYVTTGTSCIDSVFQTITVEESPDVSFSFTSTCLGDSTHFTDLTTTSSGNLISWMWIFNNTDSINIQNPAYLFTNSDTFPVILTVSSDIGCSASDTMMITVFALPLVDFTVENKCSDKVTQFFDLSTVDQGNLINWSWNFDDPASGSANLSSLQNPTHIYDFQGNYSVYLEVESNAGCKNSVTKLVEIARTPYANFSTTQACDGEHVSFTYLDNTFPSNATNWYWDFGNGATSTIDDPATLYLTWGTYDVTLIVADSSSGCSDTIIKPVDVDPNPIALFVNTSPCVGSPFVFEDSSYVPVGLIQGWEWTINSSVFNSQNPSYTFQDTGNHVISLVVTTDAGCSAGIIDTITVSGLPFADFSFTPTFGDAPLNVNFFNYSTGAQNYFWDFGDGSFSNALAPAHTYTDTGNFNIMLIATNVNGCHDSLIKTIYIIKPILDAAVISVFHTINDQFISISAEVSNFGTREINNFLISAKLGNSQTIQELWGGSLKSGETVFYSFNAAIEKSDEANFICVKTESPNGESDNNPFNNEKCLSLAENFEILSIYPNPFSDIFIITYNMLSKGKITIELFDNSGKIVSKLFEGNVEEGYNSFTFSSESENVSNGSYVLKLSSETSVVYRKIAKF